MSLSTKPDYDTIPYGTETDRDLARRYGVSHATIVTQRNARGIEPVFPRHSKTIPTPRQREILRHIELFMESHHGQVPTRRELCWLSGIGSTNGVTDHLEALGRKGYVIRDRGHFVPIKGADE